jgi:hypothetical protein
MNIPSTNDADVMAISPSSEGTKYLIKVGTIEPVSAGLSSTLLAFTLNVSKSLT